MVAIFTGRRSRVRAQRFGKEAFTPPAKEVGKFLRQWVQKCTKTKSKRKPKRNGLSAIREKIDRGLKQLDEGRTN
jgi:hypothetical protein